MSSYRVVQATRRGTLEIAERPLVDPGPLHVRIRVEACGICHSDSLAVEGRLPTAEFPRVPGHEAVGRIDALGAGVIDWRVGQRVGVGYLGGNCGQCAQCRRGHLDGGPIEIGSSDLVLSARSVVGSLTGSAQDGEDALNFSVLQNVRSTNEVIPLEEAPAGYARMMSNAARFRVVLTMSPS